MTRPQTKPTPPIPVTVSHTLKILELMTKLDFSPREFMYTFFSSTREDIIYRLRLMKIGKGEKQNKSILKNFGNLIKSSPAGQDFWESFILKEASLIVNTQEVVRGAYPKGGYVSSNQIPIDFFSKDSEARRTEQIKQGMPFLHSLISQKISKCLKSKDSNPDMVVGNPKQNGSRRSSINPQRAPNTPDTAVQPENEEEVLSLANLVYVKSTPTEVADHKAEVVPVAICAMIAYICNRRCNAVPMQNGLMVLAGGVSCRVNEYLQCFGLTTSRDSVLDAMEHLRISQEAQMMQVFKVNQKLLPFLCFDNVDIHLRIHNSRIDMSSRLFHGTWGFYIVFRAALLASCDAEAVSLAAFVEAMKTSDQKPIKIESFAPRPSEAVHFEAVIKAQLAFALTEHVKHLPDAPLAENLPALKVHPPKIDPIEYHTPNIHFLRMMDAPDSSADGVSQVLDQVMTQIGMEKDEYAKSLLVAGGDVGSNQLVESLRGKLHPPIDSIEGSSWVLSVFGPAHTTWNFAKAIWALHWGNTSDGEDRGGWWSSFELGGDYSKPVAQQDFNSIMRSIQIVHKANLVFIIGEVIKSLAKVDLTQKSECEHVLQTAWTRYFSASALREANAEKNSTKYKLMLRLRDFGTVVEAHNATRAGDIGRLIAMWKRWSIMAQGLTGLSHYARHIPRMVLLLEEDLPPDLAHVIKHSLLVPSLERDGHWMPIDEYLEVHIFWLKEVYNNTGHGTNIERLTYRYSNNIPMLRRLIQLIKAFAGHKIIFQSNANKITEASMANFLRYANENLVITPAGRVLPMVNNVFATGLCNMNNIIQADSAEGQSSRFRWGSSAGYEADDVDGGFPEEG